MFICPTIHNMFIILNEKDSFEPAYSVKTNIETQPEINSANNTHMNVLDLSFVHCK